MRRRVIGKITVTRKVTVNVRGTVRRRVVNPAPAVIPQSCPECAVSIMPAAIDYVLEQTVFCVNGHRVQLGPDGSVRLADDTN